MLLDEESARQLERAVREIAAESYGIRVLDLRVCKASGHLCQVEMTMTNLLNNPSVRGIVLNTRDVSERKMLEDQLVYSAFHDSLTTLANRALFRDRVEDTLETAGRDGIAVLFLDLDSFKQVNDLLGHASGDLLLVQVAERLRHSVRPGDTVARLGGDEFAVLLEGADDATAVDVAERITNALRTPFVVDGQEILVRGSLGLAIASADARSADKLLRNADLAMYRAKAAGEGGFERYDPEMHVDLVERLQLEADLRRAIEGNELVLHYQPIVEIATGRISGVEALARWRHPDARPAAAVVVHPDRGGQRVDRRARQLGAAGGVLPGECLAFDVRRSPSSRSASTSRRASSGRGSPNRSPPLLEETRLPAECLVLEMTESVLMDHTEENLAYLTAFKDMGVRLAIDDFGTGFSSLSYLHRFPVDVLKIDRSFVEALSDTPTERALVATIVQLGRTLHMRTVAEGVETETQARALVEMGCDHGQGYYFSRPVPAGQFERLLGAETDVPEPATMRLRPRRAARAGGVI